MLSRDVLISGRSQVILQRLSARELLTRFEESSRYHSMFKGIVKMTPRDYLLNEILRRMDAVKAKKGKSTKRVGKKRPAKRRSAKQTSASKKNKK